ncbi:glycosyltransferase family 2 protein [Colwellia sp. C1TZA3]|uniref:glycosyltransferase family 2 protein n=1 Tax=Colwellia sp. C1TZA3 TaxID=2508879 RepID=UPI00174CFB68|nr:glycosyltransferase family 2 protein [Colwellia sp. C1TZA3]
MDLSIIFATYHSEEVLQKSLESYRLINTRYQWELIIVDNACRSETKELIRKYQKYLPIVFLEQPIAGKNNALNKAIPYAQSELIWFTDNDILPNPDLVDTYVNFCQEHKEYDVFGGNIQPDRSFPEWIDLTSPSIKTAYGILDLGENSQPMEATAFWGGNFLVRKAVFDAGIRFGVSGSSNKNNHIAGNETELLTRLVSLGYKGHSIIKENSVQHQIRDEQLYLKWLVRRAYNAGEGASYVQKLNLEGMTLLFDTPKYLFRMFFQDSLKLVFTLFILNKKQLCLALMKVSNSFGRIKFYIT